MFAALTLTPERLDAFLRAEIEYMGRGQYNQITVEKILAHSDIVRCARLISNELPLRFATRIKQAENSSDKWREIPGMRQIHAMFSESFKKLRLVELKDIKGAEDLDDFTEVIQDVNRRHGAAMPTFREAAGGLLERGIMDHEQVSEWLFRIMNSRMGTEMLTEHYLKLLSDTDEEHVGIVDTRCDPHEVCGQAIANVQRQFPDSGVDITLASEHQQQGMKFSFIPRYLFLIVEELLKNTVCATLVHANQVGSDPGKIHVLVCADAERVAIKISDNAGGVPFEHTEKIWEYMFSTTPSDLASKFCETTPLSGPGMGLPLCKLYTSYLGGSLHLMSMPGVGSDTFIYFHRLDITDSWTSVHS